MDSSFFAKITLHIMKGGGLMIMKTISTLPESQRRSTMVRLAKLIEEGRTVSDISSELRIPESEIHECIEWVKNVKKAET